MRIRVELSTESEEEIVIRCREESEEIRRLCSLIEHATQANEEGDLPLRLGNTEYFVPKQEVLFFETYDGKVYAHTKTGMLQTDLRLFELEQSLPYYFLRVSKSAIVNVRMIASLKRELTGNGSVTFKESDKLAYFSRAYHKILKDKIEEVRFSK